MLIGKAKHLPKIGATEKWFSWVLLANIRPDWKRLQGTNILAYLELFSYGKKVF